MQVCVSNLCKFVENKHTEQIKNYALDFPRIGQSCSCSLANELFSHNIGTQSLKGILCIFTFKKENQVNQKYMVQEFMLKNGHYTLISSAYIGHLNQDKTVL